MGRRPSPSLRKDKALDMDTTHTPGRFQLTLRDWSRTQSPADPRLMWSLHDFGRERNPKTGRWCRCWLIMVKRPGDYSPDVLCESISFARTKREARQEAGALRDAVILSQAR